MTDEIITDRPASNLEWSSSNGRRRAHVIVPREEGDTTCAVVTYRLPAGLFRRGSVGDVPLPGVMLSQARVSPCTAKTMVAGDKRLPCCRSHFGAWLRRAPVEALTLGVQPVFAWSATWCSWPNMSLMFETPSGASEIVSVQREQLEVMVDGLLARGFVTDDVAWLLRRNAWRWHGALIVPNGPPIAGAELPIEAEARYGASLVTAIYRGGEGAQEAIAEVARHRSDGARRRRDWLANVLACIYPLSFECDRHLLRELLDRTRHSTGAEWHDLAAQLARRDREEGTEAA